MPSPPFPALRNEKRMTSENAAYASWVQELVVRYWDSDGGRLLVDGYSCEQLAEQYGTPLYAYSQRTLDASWQAVRTAFPRPFDIFYSIKANPQQAFLRFFLEHGCGLEVASAGELQQSLAAGCAPQRILFAGPGKTNAELQMALDVGLGEIHVESVGELRRLITLGESSDGRIAVALRVNPRLATAAGAMQMGGRPSPFGMDEADLDGALELVGTSPHIDLAGLHLNTGTQLLDAGQLLEYYRYAVELAERFAGRLGRPLKTLDFGGGLGIPYFAGQSWLDLQVVGEGVSALMRSCQQRSGLETTRLMIEPGRFLVGPCGLYLTRVIDRKVSGGQTFVVLDGGLHHHLAATGNFGQPLRRPFPIVKANGLGEPVGTAVNLVGPLCTPLDTFARQLALPDLQPGDLVALLQSGAYARAASPLEFLGHARPPEVLVRDGRPHLVRRRGGWRDALRDQLDPTC